MHVVVMKKSDFSLATYRARSLEVSRSRVDWAHLKSERCPVHSTRSTPPRRLPNPKGTSIESTSSFGRCQRRLVVHTTILYGRISNLGLSRLPLLPYHLLRALKPWHESQLILCWDSKSAIFISAFITDVQWYLFVSSIQRWPDLERPQQSRKCNIQRVDGKMHARVDTSAGAEGPSIRQIPRIGVVSVHLQARNVAGSTGRHKTRRLGSCRVGITNRVIGHSILVHGDYGASGDPIIFIVNV